MITTNDSYLARNIFPSKDFPVYNWLCVDLELNAPYFFVEYVQIEEYSRLTGRKIISNFSDLEKICKLIRSDANLELAQISLLSPDWLNKSTGWQLNELSDVQFGNFGQKEPWVQIYTLKDGRHLIETRLNLDIEDALELQSRFSVQAYL
ncbi:hypothetical protein H8L32_06290 [Undibacterium sp. CY18W]|uniref:Uncharacterized protein n=1 Tax=Undibacterium hunanense TaxID=2762292 RepID=A0ABR6ZND0_9BURK|nr:hypothetical protein [Undibacterium hunanense]MBC3917078.1 hypothetical protein [Undibacterium hunanense]